MPISLTAHRRAQATIAEGCCLLGRLTIYTAELWCLQLIAQDYMQPIRHILLLTGVVIADLLLLSPLYLSRDAWYDAAIASPASTLAPLVKGWRFYWRAVSWRFHLWRRRTTALLLAALPAAALLSYGEHLRRLQLPASTTSLWLPLGMAVLLLGVGGALWWLCRYAAAPLLILDGYPTLAAMQLSAVAMRRRKRDYINLLGEHLWRVIASIAVIPAPWVLPTYRMRRIATLREAISSCNLTRDSV